MVLLYTHEKIKVIDQVEVPLKIDWKRKPYFVLIFNILYFSWEDHIAVT